MEEGDRVQLHKIRPEQHFTEPPPRFSEASLVRALEEHGIGRPSTYASIISTLQAREYVDPGQAPLLPHRRGPGGEQVPDQSFHPVRGLRLHRAPGR
jgi:DNA topoisomerase IA